MKIAIISDIHGNILALKAVLEDIKNNGIEKIYVLGDLAFAGPKPKDTLDFIRENLDNQVIIQGNTDEMIVKATDKEEDPYMPKKDVMAHALKYSQQVLSEENKNFLDKLPAQHTEDFEGLKVLFVHGTHRNNSEGIFKDIKYSKLTEIFSDVEAKLIFCGHTHYPVIHVNDNKQIVNVGSVGRPFEDNTRAVYVILDLSEIKDRKFHVEHRYVLYDVEQAAQDLEECEFEGSDVLAYMLRMATDRFPERSQLK